jgi:hypothetical protein
MRPHSPSRPSADQAALDRRVALLAAYADNHSAFLTVNRDTEYFEIAEVDGFVAYRRSGRIRVQFGGVVAAPDRQAPGRPGSGRWPSSSPPRTCRCSAGPGTGSTSWAVPTPWS